MLTSRKKVKPMNIESSTQDDKDTTEFLREECRKLNTELRELREENQALKDTIVKMAMKQSGVEHECGY